MILPPLMAAVPKGLFKTKLLSVVAPMPTAPPKVVVLLSLIKRFCATEEPLKASTVFAKLMFTPIKLVFGLVAAGAFKVKASL